MKDRESGWNIFSIFYKGVGVWNIKGGWNFIKVKWCCTGIIIWRGSTDLKHSSLTLYETINGLGQSSRLMGVDQVMISKT